MQRYILKFNFQIKINFLLKIYAFTVWKFRVHLKIPIGRKRIKITIISKNCRLKITAESKNYDLKIPVRVRVYARIYARMYARASDCGQIIIRTHDHDQHTNGTQDTAGTHDNRKREDSGKAEKPAYIGIIAGNEKKYKKS